MKALLADWIYLRYWLAVVTSYMGDGLAKIAVIVLASRLAEKPALFISFVVILQLLPTGVLGGLVGPLVARISPRILLVSTDLFRLVVVLAMSQQTGSPVMLSVLVALEGAGRAVFETARMAAIPKVVRHHSIPDAVALFQSTVHLINLVSPFIGGLLIGLIGVPRVLMINAATFAVSAILLWSLGVLRAAPKAQGGGGAFLSTLFQALRELVSLHAMRFLAWALIPTMFVMGLFTTNVNAQLLNVFRLQPGQLGVMQALVGLGAMTGALGAPRAMRHWTMEQVLVAGAVFFGASLTILLPVDGFWPRGGLTVLGIWSILTGLGMSLIQAPVANLLLRDLPEHLQGHGIGLANALMVNLSIVGVLAGGLVGTAIGIAYSIVLAGMLLLLAAIPLGGMVQRRDKEVSENV